MANIEGISDSLVDTISNSLNENQKLATTAPSTGVLQIIAGPGTGKTKVLISRVAYLLLKCKVPPENIIVTTFTKKAANEMVERLEFLLKGTSIDISKLLIGTFHSICYRILKIYGKYIGVADYSIANERDSNQILNEVMSKFTDSDLEFISSLPEDQLLPFKMNKSSDDHKYNGYDPKKCKRQISKLKSSGVFPNRYTQTVNHNKFLNLIYMKYQEKLKSDFLLDFDDCLLYTYSLLKSFPVLNFIKHVLVDEFQDTNEIQLQLMYEFAKGHPTDQQLQNNVTIVGDPDQSIYAFRDAQSINFEKMKQFYEGKGLHCGKITLNENYRSTSDILNFSERIMRQQSNRIMKTLRSQTETTFCPVYSNLKSSEEEAKWIAYQIEYLLALPNCIFSYGDISILVRSAYQTRVIENEFVRRRIPYLMVKGKAFWERKEVICVLDYLRIVSNENDRIAYIRTLNFPKRGIGDKTLASFDTLIEEYIVKIKCSVFGALWKIVESDTNVAKLASKTKLNLKTHLEFIQKSRLLLNEINKDPTPSALEKFFEFIYINSGIKKEFEDDENYDLNIMEVKRQLCEFEPREEDLPLFIGGIESEKNKPNVNFLAQFISSVGLFETDTKKEDKSVDNSDSKKGKVALSTIHGSKGLEWPIVFVPGLSEGLLPAKFAMSGECTEKIDEERRCFYVATTRARSLLYVSSYTEDVGIGKWGRKPIDTVSRFVCNLKEANVFSNFQSAFSNWDSLYKLYEFINIEPPRKEEFNLLKFKKSYEIRLEIYLKGESFELTTDSFNNSSSSPNNSLYNGFSSAKSKMNHPVEQKIENPNSVFKKTKSQGSISMFFKPPRQIQDIDRNANKAPPYIVSRQFSSNLARRNFAPPRSDSTNASGRTEKDLDIQISGPKNNRAPPYIPVRKIPSRMQLKRKLDRNIS